MALKLPIFMDSQSTTPVDPRVLEFMLPYFTEKFGHPASRNHPFGWEAEAAVDRARTELARLLGARDPKEIVFTSGGTESINLALKGAAEMYREKGNHIVTTAIDQRATMDVCKRLERQGFEVTYAPVGHDGRRRSRAGDALGDGGGAAGGRLREGRRDLPRGDGRGVQAAGGAPRPPARLDRLQGGRGLRERAPGAAVAAQPERLVRLRGGRIGADGAQQGSGPVLRLGLHLGDARALLRHLGAGGRLRAGALLDPFRPAPVHDRGRGGLRRQAHGRGGPPPAGNVAALRDGERGRGSEVSALESGITALPSDQEAKANHGVQRQGDRSLQQPAQRG